MQRLAPPNPLPPFPPSLTQTQGAGMIVVPASPLQQQGNTHTWMSSLSDPPGDSTWRKDGNARNINVAITGSRQSPVQNGTVMEKKKIPHKQFISRIYTY